MSSGLQATLILGLATGLALVSALAGALWWRSRSLPLVEALQMARALSVRLRSLEALLDRLEAAGARARRVDDPEEGRPSPEPPPRQSGERDGDDPRSDPLSPRERAGVRARDHQTDASRLAPSPALRAPSPGGRGEEKFVTSAPTLIAVPDLATPAPPEAALPLAGRFGEIWELADAGEPAEAIARRVEQPVGHVELILGLRRSMEGAATRPDRGGPP